MSMGNHNHTGLWSHRADAPRLQDVTDQHRSEQSVETGNAIVVMGVWPGRTVAV